MTNNSFCGAACTPVPKNTAEATTTANDNILTTHHFVFMINLLELLSVRFPATMTYRRPRAIPSDCSGFFLGFLFLQLLLIALVVIAVGLELMCNQVGRCHFSFGNHLVILKILDPGVVLRLQDGGILRIVVIAGDRYANNFFDPLGGLLGVGIGPALSLLDGPYETAYSFRIFLVKVVSKVVIAYPCCRTQIGFNRIGNFDLLGVQHTLVEWGVNTSNIDQTLFQSLNGLNVRHGHPLDFVTGNTVFVQD